MSTQHNVQVFTASTVTFDLKVDGLFIHPWTFRFEHFLGAKCHSWTFCPNIFGQPTVWHFVPWLHFIHTYWTSIFPIKIVTFRPIVTFRHFVTLHPDCFLSPFFPFWDILSLYYTCLILWRLVHTFGVTVRQNRNLPTHGSVCRVP
jgi:hypothetical protein